MENQIICFLPCCASKNPSGKVEGWRRSLSQKELSNTWSQLMTGRNGMRWCINLNSPLTSAIHLYTGSPYDTIDRNLVVQNIKAGRLRLIIISAGYGIVDALEPIHEYEAEMKGRIASHWRSCGLINIICDFLLNANPSKVIGFFAGDVDWLTTGSKYRYFFTEGLRMAKGRGLKTQLSGCFYRQSGLGVKAILGALGRTLMGFMNYDFNDQFAIDVHQRGRRDGNVVIGFDKI
jgi:hypothetical protein